MTVQTIQAITWSNNFEFNAVLGKWSVTTFCASIPKLCGRGFLFTSFQVFFYLPVFKLHIGNIAWPMKLGSPNMSSSLTTNRRYAKGGLMTSTSNVTHHTGFKPLSAETTTTQNPCSQPVIICCLGRTVIWKNFFYYSTWVTLTLQKEAHFHCTYFVGTNFNQRLNPEIFQYACQVSVTIK